MIINIIIVIIINYYININLLTVYFELNYIYYQPEKDCAGSFFTWNKVKSNFSMKGHLSKRRILLYRFS